MLEEFYTKYAHGFFFLDVVFPCSFIDKHFRVAVEPFHYRRIIFFVRPFENLIGRRFPQFSLSRAEMQSLSTIMMSPTAGTVSVSNVVSMYHEIPSISNSIFTMSFYCLGVVIVSVSSLPLSLLNDSESCCTCPKLSIT